MLYFIIGFAGLIIGSFIGIVLTCIMAVSSKDSRAREKNDIKENIEIKTTELKKQQFAVMSKDLKTISGDEVLKEKMIKAQFCDYFIKCIFNTNLIKYDKESDYYYFEFWTKE